jgi:hypothetical protein
VVWVLLRVAEDFFVATNHEWGVLGATDGGQENLAATEEQK